MTHKGWRVVKPQHNQSIVYTCNYVCSAFRMFVCPSIILRHTFVFKVCLCVCVCVCAFFFVFFLYWLVLLLDEYRSVGISLPLLSAQGQGHVYIIVNIYTSRLPYLPYVFGGTSMSNQYRPWWDAAERGVSSGSILFATHPATFRHNIG